MSANAWLCQPNSPLLHGVTAELTNRSLWQQFNECNTEMIITKSGRWVPYFIAISFFFKADNVKVSFNVYFLYFFILFEKLNSSLKINNITIKK